MRKVAILTSILAILGAGNAAAFDASRGFGPSDANDQPVPRFQAAPQVDRMATASIGDANRSFGFPSEPRRPGGWSAAMGFGPSDANDRPVPRFQIGR